MIPAGENFSRIVQGILRRFCAQNAFEVPADALLRELADRLWLLVEERGLPPPLGATEEGKPGDLADAECGPMLARVLGPAPAERHKQLAVPVRQLVKACFHPEFRICRDSFREVSGDGSCRRQQLERVRARVSGAHCIDCPHWLAFQPAEHVTFLQREWLPAGRAELAEHLNIFLPEDFRQLRHLLYAHSRRTI